NPEILSGWFTLFSTTKEKYKVAQKDIYNMHEKGCMMGVIGKFRVIVSKYEKNAFMI
ncbi:hypothetical protein F5884DRAFT_686825, partial [Xylogone sp. PMI_703]